MATVIFKASEACNARCIYCDVVRKNDAVKTMSLETLEAFFFRINEFLTACPDEKMEIIWHGGEPLLLGPNFFEQTVKLQERLCAGTLHRIQHAMQSNLTLFSDRFTDVLRKLGIDSIGTSYDPVSQVRGLGKNRDSEAYNRRFMEGLRLVEKEGFRWGVIYVVTKLSLAAPLDIFRFLTNLGPQGSVMFNPVNFHNRKLEHLEITPAEYSAFLGKIFPVWWKHRERYGNVEPFQSLKRSLVDGDVSLSCSDAGSCAHSHINLAPDGRLSQCGRSSDYGVLDYGSVLDRPFKEVLSDPQRETLLDRNKVLPDSECKGCRFWPICHGGCPLDAWAGTGSFLHKTPLCAAKKDFIERYFEPIVSGKSDNASPGNQASAVPSEPPRKSRQPGKTELVADNKIKGDNEFVWIDPVGGLGDTLMISGVLKRAIEAEPARKFNLVARTKYGPILKGHPSIAHIGHPPPGAKLIRTHYWEHENHGQPGQRAFQLLASMVGLETPVDESLYVPWEFENDPLLIGRIPWKKKNILICPSSDSPRKQMNTEKWEFLVKCLGNEDVCVVQVGKPWECYVRGSYSLLGLTTPRQLISIIPRFDAVVTSDNFVMHAAHLCKVSAVVLWGPTDHQVYGYQEQIHLQSMPSCKYKPGCIGAGRGHLYATPCPEDNAHCMNQIDLEKIVDAVSRII